MAGFSAQGEGGNTQGATENIYSVSNATSRTFGGHTLRFGLQAQFRKFEHLTDNSTRGNFTFNGNFTGNAVADYLLGYCSTCAGAFGASGATYNSPTIAPFIDDNWQVNDKLSLQLGLRWEYLAPWAEQNGVEAAFDTATGKIGYNALPTTMPAALVPLVHQQEHYFPDGILQKDLNNWGPRVGVAYNLTDRMVLRSGFGVYYDNLNLNELQFTRLIPPYYGQFSLNPPVTAPLQVDTLFPDLNNIPQFPAPFSMDPSNRSPYTMQWNVNFQRSLGRDYLVEAAYTGSREPQPDQALQHQSGGLRDDADQLASAVSAVPAGDAVFVGHRMGGLQGSLAAPREALLRGAVLPRQLPVVGEPRQRFRRGRGERHRVQDQSRRRREPVALPPAPSRCLQLRLRAAVWRRPAMAEQRRSGRVRARRLAGSGRRAGRQRVPVHPVRHERLPVRLVRSAARQLRAGP